MAYIDRLEEPLVNGAIPENLKLDKGFASIGAASFGLIDFDNIHIR